MDKETLSHYGWIVILVLILSCMIIMSTPLGKFWVKGFEATYCGFGQAGSNAMDIINPTPNPDPNPGTDTPTPPEPITPPEDGETYTEGDYRYTYHAESEYNDDGWHVKAIRNDKTEYQPILTEIKGKPIVDMMETFVSCYNMTKSPAIPDTVLTMTRAYDRCTSLKTAPTIPDSVREMVYTFDGCTSLETATIPKNAVCLNGTFSGCTSLKTVYHNGNSKVEQMGYTFQNCTSLKDLNGFIIPETVQSINGTFMNCKALTGTIIIEMQNYNSSYQSPREFVMNNCGKCFYGTTQTIYITGNTDLLEQIALTSENGNVHVA